MPWIGVTVSEQRQRFLEDYRLNCYSITELAERFSISRKTAHTHPGHQGKWINHYKEHGQRGFRERSLRPRKLLDLMHRRNPRGSFLRFQPGPGSLPEKAWSSLGGAIGRRIPGAQ